MPAIRGRRVRAAQRIHEDMSRFHRSRTEPGGVMNGVHASGARRRAPNGRNAADAAPRGSASLCRAGIEFASQRSRSKTGSTPKGFAVGSTGGDEHRRPRAVARRRIARRRRKRDRHDRCFRRRQQRCAMRQVFVERPKKAIGGQGRRGGGLRGHAATISEWRAIRRHGPRASETKQFMPAMNLAHAAGGRFPVAGGVHAGWSSVPGVGFTGRSWLRSSRKEIRFSRQR